MTTLWNHAVYAIRNNENSLLSSTDLYSQIRNWTIPLTELKDKEHFKQLWLLVYIKGTDNPPVYHLRCISSGNNLTVEPEYRWRDGKYCSAYKPHGGPTQQWTFDSLGNDQFRIKNVEYGTALEQFTYTGVLLCGANNVHDGPSQAWTLERRSRGSSEIHNLISTHPMCRTVQSRHYAADSAYITLPDAVRQEIWKRTRLGSTTWREEIFDCDDFAYVMKAEVAKWANENIFSNNISLLMGMYFGTYEDQSAGHAFNWYLTQDLKSLMWFEPQDGKEDDNALNFLADWMWF